jgi:hypothetical protein
MRILLVAAEQLCCVTNCFSPNRSWIFSPSVELIIIPTVQYTTFHMYLLHFLIDSNSLKYAAQIAEQGQVISQSSNISKEKHFRLPILEDVLFVRHDYSSNY